MAKYAIVNRKTHRVEDVVNLSGYDHDVSQSYYFIKSETAFYPAYYDENKGYFFRELTLTESATQTEPIKPVVPEIPKPVEPVEPVKPIEPSSPVIPDNSEWHDSSEMSKLSIGKLYRIKTFNWEGDAIWIGDKWYAIHAPIGSDLASPIFKYAEIT